MTAPTALVPARAGAESKPPDSPPHRGAGAARAKGRVGFPKLRALLEGEGAEAKRLCAAILEVLAGARTPSDAASALGVSLPRYYALEERALVGLLSACERRPRGRRVTPEREAAKLAREVDRLERECARSQALLRSAQRAVGLSAPEKAKPEAPGKRRARRAKPRALRVARILKAPSPANELEGKRAASQDKSEVKA
jgi:hypothetical protein